jgi:phenylacetate-CoA ligase
VTVTEADDLGPGGTMMPSGENTGNDTGKSTGMNGVGRREQLQQRLLSRLPVELGRVDCPREEIHRVRDERLRALVRHARQHSPWHRKRLAHLDPHTVSPADLATVPPMTKADLMANWDDIVTDPEVRLADAQRHIDSLGAAPSFFRGEHIVLATSGATGRRGVIAWDADAFVDCVAANLRHALWQERRLDRPLHKLAMLYAHNPAHATSASSWLLDRAGSTVRLFSPATPLAEIVAELNEFQPDGVSGYASMLRLIADAAERGALRIAPVGLQASGEALHPHHRERIERVFGVPVFQSYGATETGPIAVSNPPLPELHLSEDVVVFEPVDGDHRPVPDGVESESVLVTNLLNRLLPLIRYELTDRVTMAASPNPGPFPGRRISSITGRTMDVFTLPGARVQFAALYSPVILAPGVVEAQLRQVGEVIEVSVVACAAVDTDGLRSTLCGILGRHGVPDPRVEVRVVDRLDRHPRSGKLARYVPPRTER